MDHTTHRHGWRFPPDRRHVLKDEERLRTLPPRPLLEVAGFKAGNTVLDVGAGTGFWTAPLAEIVGPEGEVIALDVEPIMLEELRDLVATRELSNVEVMQSEELSLPLPDGIAHGAMLGFVLHEPSDPGVFLREIARVLKPSSRILNIDWHKRPTESGPPVVHRLSEEEASSLLSSVGFTVQSLEIPTPDAYALLGTR